MFFIAGMLTKLRFNLTISNISTLKCLEIVKSLLYFVELCTKKIPNAFSDVQTLRILHFLSPVANICAKNSQRVRKEVGKCDST